ncbi:hypothetical protein [Streptomyces sp. B6B3]|uniref:hypothetical protein n=1 Tax=Streptomyces sp. B6B3 TaxID=3153570 RepID=UPI00325E2397
MGDFRDADPDQLDELAARLWPRHDSVYHRLVAAYRRAAELGVSAELTPLRPMLEWLTNATPQLREAARILRSRPERAGGWEWRAVGSDSADAVVALSGKPDLRPDDLATLRDLLADHADDPDFAGCLVDRMGVAEFLRLCERVNAAAAATAEPATAAGALHALTTTTLASAFAVPAGTRFGSPAYRRWTRETAQGRRLRARLAAFAEADALRAPDDAPASAFWHLTLLAVRASARAALPRPRRER